MSKIKKIIIILVVILVIAIIALAIVLLTNNNGGGQQMAISEDEGIDAYEKELDTTVNQVTNRIDYYTVKDCLGKYYSYYSILLNPEMYYTGVSEEDLSQAEQDNAQTLYNMLDNKYITEKGITVDNLETSLKDIGIITPYISNMYVNHRTDNMDIYVVEGKIRTGIQDAGEDFRIILKLDLLNKTFSIMPSEYVAEKYGNIIEGQNLDIEVEDSITKNDNNQYTYRTITEENYMKDLFAEVRNELLYDKEAAYEHLNEEYRSEKFATLDEFNNFVASREEEYKTMVLAQYQVTQEDGYTQYVLVDQNGKYYILNETGVMKYTTILDTYTVDLPQFIEKYNESTSAEKAGLNMQKVVDALNNGDYSYIYSKLDDTFKANNFGSVESFEEYIQNNLYSSVNVEYSNYKSSGELHMYDVTFTNKDNQNSEPVTKTFIIKPLEGTDFVMSFNV